MSRFSNCLIGLSLIVFYELTGDMREPEVYFYPEQDFEISVSCAQDVTDCTDDPPSEAVTYDELVFGINEIIF